MTLATGSRRLRAKPDKKFVAIDEGDRARHVTTCGCCTSPRPTPRRRNFPTALDGASRTENAQALDWAAQLAARCWRYWLQLRLRSWNAFCWMVVGLVTTVSG